MAPPVLLLHGWGGSFASTFAATGWPAALADRGLRTLPLDLPGHGKKPASIAPDDYADLAGLVAAVLPDGRVDIVGYSLGAKIALELAARHPGRVRRIALIGLGDNAFAREPAADAIVAALEDGVSADTPSRVRALVEYSRASGSDPRALAAVLKRPANPIASAERLSAIGRQALLLNGSNDELAIPDDGLKRALPGLTYVLIDGLGHIAVVGDPAVQATCAAFLTAEDERETITTTETLAGSI